MKSIFEGKEFEYQYFDLPSLTKGLLMEDSKIAVAQDLVKRNIVTLENINTDYKSGYYFEDSLQCHATGRVHDKRGFIHDVRVSMNNESITKILCDVPGCSCRYDRSFYFSWASYELEICEHVAALFYRIREYQKEHILGDATDVTGIRVLNLFRKEQVQRRAASEAVESVVDKIDIEPRLILDEDRLHLSFKVGADKMYIMKSIRDFYIQYINKGSVKLGKTSSIQFTTAQFTERAKRFIEFISKEVKQELDHKKRLEESTKSWYRPEVKAEGMGAYLDMYGTRLDEFFDMEMGHEICFVDKNRSNKESKIVLREKGVKAMIEITPCENGRNFEGIQIHGEMPPLIEGFSHLYFVEGSNLYRLEEESRKNLEIISKISEDGEFDIRIGRNNIAEFYYRVLPELEKCADIQNFVGSLAEDFLPKDMDIIFYLDAEENMLICNPVAKYENETVSLLDMLNPEEVLNPSRDKLKEKEALDVALTYFPEQLHLEQMEKGYLFCENDEELVYQLLNQGLEQMMVYGEVRCTDRFKSRNTKRSVKVSVGVSVHSSIMDLEISSDDVSPEELLDILESYRKKKKYHRLKSGEFVDITEDSIKELSDMMESMHIDTKEFITGKMHLPLYRALYLDKMLENCQEIYTSRDKIFRNLVKGFKTVSDADFEVPDSLDKVLRNYQKYGHKWMRVLANNNFNGILADDMGLGKTLQMISVLSSDRQGTSLIVCPASLVYNWKEEFSKFAPDFKVEVIAGKQEERIKSIRNCEDYDILITSYDLLKRDIAEYDGKIFHYEVIDEAQYIKTHTTAAAKSVKLIQANHKMALTGTPIENRLSELWSIFDYLMPGFLYNYETFKKELESPIVKNKDEHASNRLKRMVSPFILRRLKSDVLKDLPNKIEEIQYARMGEKQQQLYDAQVIHMKDVIAKQDEASFNKNKIQILAELTRIRQICCDPSLMVENYKGESAKLQACMELVERAIEGEHKMLIFSQFTSMLDIIADELKARKIDFYTITGATTKEKRLEYVKKFNSDTTPVFLISLKAGGTGLNLTGADMVIHYDPWWNVAAQNQATDRAHRIGQTRIVTVYKLIIKDSIEEKIVKMQLDKANLANEILSGENGNIIHMTREDLLGLL